MSRRWLIVGMAVAMFVLLLSGTAGTWFEHEATATVTGKTGYVKISVCNVTLTSSFQPGDTQYKHIVVKNVGRCPVMIFDVRIIGLPSWLGARVTPGFVKRISPGHSYRFRLYVYMPQSVGNVAENKLINFKVKFFSRNLPTAH